MNWRRIRKWFVIFALVGLVTILVMAWFVGSALVAPANRTVGPPPNDFPAVTVQFDSDSGTTLAGWYLEVPDAKATVILLHPIRADRRSMLSRARLLHKNGFSTLLVDLQAHGESLGEQITLGHLEKHDVSAAVKYVRNTTPDQKVAVIGWSLGGAAAIYAAPDVDAIVLESVYPTVTEAVHNRIEMRAGMLRHVVAPLLLLQLNPRLGVSAAQLRPIDQLGQMSCPVLLVSGDRDTHTTIEETKRMYELAKSPKQLVVFEGAEHEDLYQYDSAKYETQIMGFLENAIGGRTEKQE